MRKFILIAGFALVSAAAQAGDRSLSLGGGETTTVTAPAKATEGSKTAEVPQAVEAPRAEAPKYVERPAVVEPKPETSEARDEQDRNGQAKGGQGVSARRCVRERRACKAYGRETRPWPGERR